MLPLPSLAVATTALVTAVLTAAVLTATAFAPFGALAALGGLVSFATAVFTAPSTPPRLLPLLLLPLQLLLLLLLAVAVLATVLSVD